MDRGALYLSRLVSQLGQGLFFGVLVLISGSTSAAAVGLSSVLVAMVVASLVLGVPAGMLVDRLGAPRALLTGGVLRLIAVVTVVFVTERPEAVALVAFLYSGASQVFSPAEMAMVRQLRAVGTGGVHATLVALQYGGQALGALALAPLLYVLGGISIMVAGAALAYAIVAGLGFFIAARSRSVSVASGSRSSFAWSEATRYFRREPSATYAAALLTFSEVATKCLAVAMPFFLLDELNLTRLQLVALAIVGGLGAVAGLAWTGRSLKPGDAPRVLRLTLAGAVGAVLMIGVLASVVAAGTQYIPFDPVEDLARAADPAFMVALPAVVLLGIASSVARAGARSVLSETAPPSAQGTIFAAQGAVTDIVVILPLVAVGAMTGLAGARPALILVAAIGVAFFVLLEWALPRLHRPAPSTPRATRRAALSAQPVRLERLGAPERHNASRELY